MADTSCGCRLFRNSSCTAQATKEDLLCDACRPQKNKMHGARPTMPGPHFDGRAMAVGVTPAPPPPEETVLSDRPICRVCGRQEVFGPHEFMPGRYTCSMRTGRGA